jgi:hypothetical protein
MQQISGVKFPDANYTLNQGQKIDTMKPNHWLKKSWSKSEREIPACYVLKQTH